MIISGPENDRTEPPSARRTGARRRTDGPESGPSVAVLLPCRNEARSIGKVVGDFRLALPMAKIFVYDNASTDRTAEVAYEAGAVVRRVESPGKGNVLRRMFADVDADIYVIADGDDTYDALAAPSLIAHLRSHHLDMVVGRRVEAESAARPYRKGHRLGNRLLTRSVHWLFGDGSQDMLSGYRVLSRRYVKSFPAFSKGFETETEMTVFALDVCIPFAELPTDYRDRPEESASKLRTLPDGIKILKFIMLLCKDYRPMRFFGALAGSSALFAVGSAVSGHGQLHAWTPATFATAGFSTLAVIAVLAGVILDSLGRARREMKRMLYLAVEPAVSITDGASSRFEQPWSDELVEARV